MEDAAFVGIEAAAAGLGGAPLGSLSGDLGFDLILFSIFFADGVGSALSWVDGGVLLNLRKLGVTFRCFTFYCTKFIDDIYI